MPKKNKERLVKCRDCENMVKTTYVGNNRVTCKSCKMKNYREYIKNNRWYIVINAIRARCKKHPIYIRKGIKCKITFAEVKRLWLRDKAHLLKQPSIDRIDNDGNYTFENCRFIELLENISRRKVTSDHKKRISNSKKGKPNWITKLKDKIKKTENQLANVLKENNKLEHKLHRENRVWAHKVKELQAEAKLGNIPYKEAVRLQKENKGLKRQLADDEDGCVEDCVIVRSLQNRLNDWIYELAYYTEEEVATPNGVKKFIGKAIEDKTKENKDLREELKRKQGHLNSFAEAQPKLSKQRLEEIILKEADRMMVKTELLDLLGTLGIKSFYEAIYLAQSEEKK